MAMNVNRLALFGRADDTAAMVYPAGPRARAARSCGRPGMIQAPIAILALAVRSPEQLSAYI